MLRINKLITFLIMLAVLENTYANYVIYNNSNQTTTSTFYGSVPSFSGFSYSDGQGNSIRVGQIQYIPIQSIQGVNGIWVWANGGKVPANAIVLQYENGFPVYYCRVPQGNQMYYGQLIPNQGCVISNQINNQFSSYQTLVR